MRTMRSTSFVKKILSCFLLTFHISGIDGCSARQEKILESSSSETEIQHNTISAEEKVVLTQTSEDFLSQHSQIVSDNPSFSSRFSVIESSKFLIIVSPTEESLTGPIQPSQ